MRIWDEVKKVVERHLQEAFERGDLAAPKPEFEFEVKQDEDDASVFHMTITDPSGYLASLLRERPHVGSSFDSFLEDEGIKEEVEEAAVKRLQDAVDADPSLTMSDNLKERIASGKSIVDVMPCGHHVSEIVGNPNDPGGTCYCGACSLEAAGAQTNSIGTCTRCGYHGPGPAHICKPDVSEAVELATLDVKLIGCLSPIADYVVYDAFTDKLLGYTSFGCEKFIEFDTDGQAVPNDKRIPIRAILVDESPWH